MLVDATLTLKDAETVGTCLFIITGFSFDDDDDDEDDDDDNDDDGLFVEATSTYGSMFIIEHDFVRVPHQESVNARPGRR